MIDALITLTGQDWFPLALAVVTRAPRSVRALVRLVRRKAQTVRERHAAHPEEKD
ncbi:hypothetical protein FHX81_2322 [Saccharothrix saharensis]|uniref:Uncharacterized protein n=1 Tax=Saccharothrix saharensis TaxID=571190 RepID=A0A543JB29_9PSEU|nr:hypothetical protein [Saccharothrix saharensis]TQM80001.1 hypothetical protein FHX81_2322 [Saccharothrix saharensis]